MKTVTRRRTSVFVVAMMLLAGLAVVGAPAALAHHPVIAVTTSCDPATGGPVLSVTANSWSFVPTEAGNHDDVRIQMRRQKADGTWTGWLHEIGNGVFVPGNRSFVRNFDANSVMADFKTPSGDPETLGTMVGETVQVRLRVEDTVDDEPEDLRAGWYDDAGQYPETSSGNGNRLAYYPTPPPDQEDPDEPPIGFVIQGDCQATTVSVGVSGSCTTGQQGEAMGALSVTIAPDSGATVTVNGVAYTTSQASIPVPPGSYPWSAVAADGHVLVGAASGTALVEDCTVEQPRASLSVECTTVTNTSDEGVLIDIRGVENQLVVEGLEAGVSATLKPGSYSWSAYILVEVDEGEVEAVPVGQGGRFTTEDCSEPTTPTTVPPPTFQNVTVSLACPVAGTSVPKVTVTPQGGATVTVVDSGNGVFSWSAVPSNGYAIVGLAADVFDTSSCAEVLAEVIVATTSTTTSTTIAAVAADQLPFTGFALGRMAMLALSTLAAGMGLLAVASRREDEAPVVESDQWTD